MTPVHGIEKYRGNRSTVALILNIARCRRTVFTPRPLYASKETPVLAEHETGWVVERAWKFWRRDKSPVLAGIPTPDHPSCDLDAVINLCDSLLSTDLSHILSCYSLQSM